MLWFLENGVIMCFNTIIIRIKWGIKLLINVICCIRLCVLSFLFVLDCFFQAQVLRTAPETSLPVPRPTSPLLAGK